MSLCASGRRRRVAALALLSAISLSWLPACREREDLARESHLVPQRIVSLVPAVTEMLFALGAGNRVVGVSDFDTYPPAVLEIPRVGALLDPNLERILELQPGLVVIYTTQAALATRLDSVGIPAFSFASGSIGEMLGALRELGDLIGQPEAARALAGDIASNLEDIRTRSRGERPRVLLAHSRDPGSMGGFYTEGGPGYLNELIEIAGGENLFADVARTSFQPSLEEVLERGPEVIIELLPSRSGSPAGIRRREEDWKRLDTVPAVRDGRVHVLADDYLLLIGPRLHLAAARFYEAIHSRSWDGPEAPGAEERLDTPPVPEPAAP